MAVQHVQTKHEIKTLLDLAGLRPRKRFGQHFLIDGNLMRRLADAASLGSDDMVLEVGGGTGGLTDLMVDRVSRVLCVEIDRNLRVILEERFEGVSGFTLIWGDILAGKHDLHLEVGDAIRAHDPGSGGCVKLVANLPYQVATPLVINLIVDYPQVRRLCFTVQAEVGDRFAAPEGCKAYGPVSIVAQALCRVETLARVPPQAFWPRPTVGSAMLRLDVGESPFAEVGDLREFVTLVRGVFDHRRKTLRSALGYVVSDPVRDHLCREFDGSRRPESFSVEEWLSIFRESRPRRADHES